MIYIRKSEPWVVLHYRYTLHTCYLNSSNLTLTSYHPKPATFPFQHLCPALNLREGFIFLNVCYFIWPLTCFVFMSSCLAWWNRSEFCIMMLLCVVHSTRWQHMLRKLRFFRVLCVTKLWPVSSCQTWWQTKHVNTDDLVSTAWNYTGCCLSFVHLCGGSQ